MSITTMHDGRVVLHQADCIAAMDSLAENSIDSIVCDPPYHLTSIVKRFGKDGSAPPKEGTDGAFQRASRGFMGKSWDGVDTPKLDAGLGYWLAGFADGEGCFTVRKSGKGFICEFIIHLRADDAKILREVHAATEIGDIDGPRARVDGNAPMVKWIVRRQADCAKLVQIFRAFPLRAKKARDFEVWASAVSEWIEHEPGTSWEDLRSHADLMTAVKQYGSSLDASQIFHYRWARQALRVLKPGGHVVAFSGTRTYHRLAAAIEDAGFEIRDQLGWVYGSGFPKSHNQHGDWEGWGTALKPAWEPICLARKPLCGTVASNLAQWGVGAINVDGCRVDAPDGVPQFLKQNLRPGSSFDVGSNRTGEISTIGRWPANIIHDGSDEVLAAFPDAPGQQRAVGPEHGAKDSVNCYGDFGARDHFAPRIELNKSAARFFYCAKASRADRDPGLSHLPKKAGGMVSNTSGQHITRRDEGYNPAPRANTHPTVKPTTLMQWLCRLVTPPGGVILDPFMGSGSTGKAAVLEGFRFIGCEREDEYMPIAAARIAWAIGREDRDVTQDEKRPAVAPQRPAANDNDLFSTAGAA